MQITSTDIDDLIAKLKYKIGDLGYKIALNQDAGEDISCCADQLDCLSLALWVFENQISTLTADEIKTLFSFVYEAGDLSDVVVSIFNDSNTTYTPSVGPPGPEGPPGIGGDTPYDADFVVSLAGGKTYGKYTNGQTVPAMGKTPKELLKDIAIEDIFPTYAVPILSLIQSDPVNGEVGENISPHALAATFTRNDAGVLTAIKIKKNTTDLSPTGTTSPLSLADNVTRILGTINYQATAAYNAGVAKNLSPSGITDPRTPAIRSVSAPQAADSNFLSNIISLIGWYKYFFGPVAAEPTNSSGVRALPSNQLSYIGNTFIYNTGTTRIIFAISYPATKTLSSVIDLDNASTNITSSFVLHNFNVNDAGGNAVAYTTAVLTLTTPYPVSARHQVILI